MADQPLDTLVAAVKADLAHNRQKIEPLLAARKEPQFQNPEVRFVQSAQNTLRTCMEATLQEAMPYSDMLCIELAIRLASYAVSALPLERQHEALDRVLRSLPAAHASRLSKGIVIKTDWVTDGVAHSNMPAGRA